MKIPYFKQLQSKKWISKKKEILERDKKCVLCGDTKNLHIHHIKYIKGRMAWDYPNTLLTALCGSCHLDYHNKNEVEVIEDKRAKRIFKAKTFKPKKKIVLSKKDKILQSKYDLLKSKGKLA